ncbi:hypothetical protein K402DRAFT_155998 [Aulographum hederae CBS 113979]|uniref:Uncharacterized protein n=1 Tax=Aulographum hederae CBS 113979 TaxID=1176131 RepID=A0A6G1GS89_9PEZI|nr:hypothetical protein K402DRAFT_155998 [Aulographum hederae CBS 113979]
MSSTAPAPQPSSPSQAQGAQIPLQSFNLPSFPREAQGLKALTLTSDIKLDEYTDLLKQAVAVPTSIPRGIESLTLELFSMGYPPGFLESLSKQLPNVKSLVLYSQLFAGISPESAQDAEKFFETSKNLRAIHFLDVFSRPGFVAAVAPHLRGRERPVLFLEINYSFRHADDEFLDRVPAEELPELISPSLVSCAFNFSEMDRTDDPDDPTNLTAGEGEGADGKKEGKAEGIRAFEKEKSGKLVQVLLKEETAPRTLKALNVTMYTLAVEQLKEVLEKHKGLMVLNVTLEAGGEDKEALLEMVEKCPELEQVEIVLSADVQDPSDIRKSLVGICPDAKAMQKLSQQCSKLHSLKISVLRTTSSGTVDWDRSAGFWKGGFKAVEA